ncbi:MAG: antibiotic biosynthesis monooxygenase [Cyclobacteriaceae bacterium]|nr:antibiotic biosynthesis monooxygenase [Cyclobacteriaceae bacterium]
MIKRVVKMKFRAEELESFLAVFDKKKAKILQFEGCSQVDLLQDIHDKNTCFTISIWNSEEDLNNYRNSDFFQSTWKNVKTKFDEKPKAWSLKIIA